MRDAPTLLADVGGTNTRLAMSWQGEVMPDTVQRRPNAEAGSFEQALKEYLSAYNGVPPQDMVVAIAGPVSGPDSGPVSGDGPARSGKLTNGSWRFETGQLAAQTGIPRVRIINDLEALGHAVPALKAEALQQIRPGRARGHQSLVVGVATGFNVSLTGGGKVFQAELGHASLPLTVFAVLQERLGAGAAQFATVEHCFSGAGLSHMHAALTGDHLEPSLITSGIDRSRETLQLFARALGVMCRELVYQYMPLGGLYFNGSLARAILCSALAEVMVRNARDDHGLAGAGAPVPIYLITDDAAALTGCARYLSS